MTYRAEDPKFNFQCTSHLQGLDYEYCAGKAQLSAKDPSAAANVTIPTVMRAENETAGLINGCCGGGAHS